MKYVLKTIDEVKDRIQKVLDQFAKNKKLGKRDTNSLEWCIRKLETTRMLVERDLQPKKPRVIADAIRWIESQKKNGTWLALLTEEGQLVKTVFLTDHILDKIPEAKITETPLPLTIKKIELVIPELNFAKVIPKKVKAYKGIRKFETKAEVIK